MARIPITQQILAILFSIALLLVTIHLVRKRKLREEYALLWLGAAATIFLLVVFHGLVASMAAAFGVSYPPTLILVFGLLFAIVVILSQSVAISSQADRIRDLAQNYGLLDQRLRQVERELDNAVEGLSSHDIAAGAFMQPDRSDSVEQVKKTGTVPVPGEAANLEMTHERIGAVEGVSNGASHSSSLSTRNGTTRSHSKRSRVLVIGLDGATFDLIKPWSEQGYLPTLTKLLNEGAHGSLESTIPPMTGPAWTSFATGVNPGKHRLYDWIAREDGAYRFLPMTAADCRAPTLYSLLGEMNRRVCVLNVPMTYPPMPVNGVQVSGLPAPSTKVPITYPDNLLDEINAAVGEYLLYPDPGQAYSDSGVDSFLQRLYVTTDVRVQTLDYLRSREDWDFTMVVFNGTDTVSHAMWKFMDETHPLYDPRKADKYGNAIRDYYQYVDTKMARMVDQLDEDTTLVVMSDHGFGPFHKFIHVNNWLMQQGYMQTKSGAKSQMKRRMFNAGFSPMNVYDNMMRFGLGAMKKEVVRGQGMGQDLMKTLFLSFDDIDWRRTRAYSLGNVGQIYLNVVGREPFGCVRPGEEYDQLRDEIIARLRELRDPANGALVVETIYKREDIYSGDYLENAPDIVFLPRNLEYFGFGEYEFGSHQIIEPMKRGISGTHRMNGIFMAYGAAIRGGTEVKDANLVDLAPTIMHLMGESVPEHMDGRVLTEAIVEGDREIAKQQWNQSRDSGAVNGGAAMSDADRKALAERLRSLGYVG